MTIVRVPNHVFSLAPATLREIGRSVRKLEHCIAIFHTEVSQHVSWI
jgi:hypothetical protein